MDMGMRVLMEFCYMSAHFLERSGKGKCGLQSVSARGPHSLEISMSQTEKAPKRSTSRCRGYIESSGGINTVNWTIKSGGTERNSRQKPRCQDWGKILRAEEDHVF